VIFSNFLLVGNSVIPDVEHWTDTGSLGRWVNLR